MIIVASVFRNSESYISRYAEQIAQLRRATTESVHVIAVEGDSTDETYKELLASPQVDTVLHAEHGGQMFGSIVHPQRWRQLSVVCNVALCAATRLSAPGDRTIYVESDLIWEADTMMRLLADLRRVQAVAPMSMFGMKFYDTWGHTMNGRQFSSHRPYYPGWTVHSDTLTPIDTAGSCFALTHDALRVVEFSAQDCIRGIGRCLDQAGFTLYIDPTVKVEHPRDDHHC